MTVLPFFLFRCGCFIISFILHAAQPFIYFFYIYIFLIFSSTEVYKVTLHYFLYILGTLQGHSVCCVCILYMNIFYPSSPSLLSSFNFVKHVQTVCVQVYVHVCGDVTTVTHVCVRWLPSHTRTSTCRNTQPCSALRDTVQPL